MEGAMKRTFGIAWFVFAVALVLHVADEACHDFLSFYNPSVQAIRARLPLLPLPTFTFAIWLAGLLVGIGLLFFLTPWAFHVPRWMRVLAVPLAVIVGIFNVMLHITGSLYFHRFLPGVYSSPVLLAAAIFLLCHAWPARPIPDNHTSV